jgi:hypothetical protein
MHVQAFLDVGFGESELGVVLEKFGQVETVHQKQKPTALYQQILADVIREIGIFFNKVRMMQSYITLSNLNTELD